MNEPTGVDRAILASQSTTPTLILNGWVVQNIVYELLANYFLMVTPKDEGFQFSYTYKVDNKGAMASDSGIFLDIGFNWRQDIVGKRPAVFVHRGDEKYTYPTLGQTAHINAKESEIQKLSFTGMSISVTCIATEIGLVEQIAEYVKLPLKSYQTEIQRDFRFRKFRVLGKSKPELFNDTKEHFSIELDISVDFDEGCIIKRDDLKLKKVSRLLFDSITKQQFINQ